MNPTRLLVAALATILLPFLPASAITIDTVPVGDAGNIADQLYPNNNPENARFGAVGYDYRIGRTEVTVGQYTAFLNAVAASDTYDLYHPAMATYPNSAGIAQSGASGSYSYSVLGSPNKPVTFVSWGDAARFVNWLHNGQPTGPQNASTTESGAYSLNGANTREDLSAVTRNADARWFIPSENEWYKAAYYQPASRGGDADGYWSYPTRSNMQPYSDQPPGSGAPTPSNTANFRYDDASANGYNDGYAVTGTDSYSTEQNYLTDGGAYAASASPYGTFDQGGNVLEWNEAVRAGQFREIRGGSWAGIGASDFNADARSFYPALGENWDLGFRVATVPEPSTAILVAASLVALAAWGLRRRAPIPGLQVRLWF